MPVTTTNKPLLSQPPGQRLAMAATGDPVIPVPGTPNYNTSPTLPPEQRLANDTKAGYDMADQYGIGKEGSMGRLTDPRAQEINDLLARQKAGLGGMTPEEMKASREQGNAEINRQLAMNMQQFGDVAAGNGIRGGAAAGLQQQALAGAQQASGDLGRKLVLDNLAQKNIAMDRYGNTLQHQQDVGIGINDNNLQTMRAEMLARQLAAGNYSSQLDAYRTGDKADALNAAGIDLLKQQVDAFKNTGGYSGKVPGAGTANTGSTANSGAGGSSKYNFDPKIPKDDNGNAIDSNGNPINPNGSYNVTTNEQGQKIYSPQPTGDSSQETTDYSSAANAEAKKRGYKDMLEWGTKDPQGFAAWKASQGYSDNTSSSAQPQYTGFTGVVQAFINAITGMQPHG